MSIALKIHSVIGIILGLLFFYAPTTWYFILISAYLIVWGLLSCCFLNQFKYHLYIKILAYIAGTLSFITSLFSLFFIVSTASGYIKNILIYLFFFSAFLLSWSILSYLYIKKQTIVNP